MGSKSFVRRKIGKEDIDFDTNGDGATTAIVNNASATLHKINASHIPVTAALRASVGNNVVDIEDVLNNLLLRIVALETPST